MIKMFEFQNSLTLMLKLSIDRLTHGQWKFGQLRISSIGLQRFLGEHLEGILKRSLHSVGDLLICQVRIDFDRALLDHRIVHVLAECHTLDQCQCEVLRYMQYAPHRAVSHCVLAFIDVRKAILTDRVGVQIVQELSAEHLVVLVHDGQRNVERIGTDANAEQDHLDGGQRELEEQYGYVTAKTGDVLPEQRHNRVPVLGERGFPFLKSMIVLG